MGWWRVFIQVGYQRVSSRVQNYSSPGSRPPRPRARGHRSRAHRVIYRVTVINAITGSRSKKRRRANWDPNWPKSGNEFLGQAPGRALERRPAMLPALLGFHPRQYRRKFLLHCPASFQQHHRPRRSSRRSGVQRNVLLIWIFSTVHLALLASGLSTSPPLQPRQVSLQRTPARRSWPAACRRWSISAPRQAARNVRTTIPDACRRACSASASPARHSLPRRLDSRRPLAGLGRARGLARRRRTKRLPRLSLQPLRLHLSHRVNHLSTRPVLRSHPRSRRLWLLRLPHAQSQRAHQPAPLQRMVQGRRWLGVQGYPHWGYASGGQGQCKPPAPSGFPQRALGSRVSLHVAIGATAMARAAH